MKSKIIISLIVSFFLAISFDFASASVVTPPVGSDLYNYWTSTGTTLYLYATNVNTIFDTDFNYLGGWANNVYYNGNLYDPCLASDKRIAFGMGAYNASGVYIAGTSTGDKYTCVGDDFTFLSDSYEYYSPADRVNELINYYSPSYVLIYFNYGMYGTPYPAKALIYIDSSGTQYLLNDDFSEYSTAVDGACGSANGGSFANTPSSDLCSSGDLVSIGVQDNGTSYFWTCMPTYSGGIADYCTANVSLQTAQCGYSNGTVALTEPYLSHACLNGSITDMTQNDDDSWSWKCQNDSDSTDFVFCNTTASGPVIPDTLPSNDSISCSISITDLSTFADCLGSIIRWAFLPHQDTLNSFYSIPQTLASKSPFGYFYAISDKLKSVSLNSPANLVISMKSFDSSDVVLLDVNSFKSWAGPEAVDFYFNIARALLWIGFLIWVFNKGRNIFSSNDNEK